MATISRTNAWGQFWNSRRGRTVRENLSAYLFLLPAGIIIFTFGIFPLGFAFFVSLHQWKRFPEAYQGLDNYVRALDGLAYVLFFWLALVGVGLGLRLLVRLWRSTRENQRGRLALLPGLLSAGAVVLLINWIFTLLPVVLDIPQRIRGQERVQGLFLNELRASLQVPQVVDAGNMLLLAAFLALITGLMFTRLIRPKASVDTLVRATLVFIFLAGGVLTWQLLTTEMDTAITAAREAGTDLPLWSQVIFISAGIALVVAAFILWQRASRQFNDRKAVVMALAAVFLLLGGYLLSAELPNALANADRDLLHGFVITVMFSAGTVPIQLAAGMGLAYLLFQNIRGKVFFRILYFLPYITPFVATSVVFKILFSHRTTSPVNNFVGILGITPQKWLLEPTGIGQLMFGQNLPDVLAGPSLALLVIMMYTIWTYIGYDAVVFLAGLGNISSELYEAARIDGASGWKIFRHITFPLLSPTTFFLSLIAIIGTFKAFTQIWIMRSPAASTSVDTMSVYIFETVRTNGNMGYGSAMAFVLFGVILILTVFQNRIMGSRVFYG
ncbi:MAG: sugar ABC transporter permease [Anaerolineae bacterium]|nr:sugar ABC transporter permease [Anaerolineae bacterium]